MNLSKNFTLNELTKSETAARLDIDNTPNDEQIESLRLLCENICNLSEITLASLSRSHLGSELLP